MPCVISRNTRIRIVAQGEMRKAAKQDFDELHKRGQENLVRFLRLEIELGQTMGQISETTESRGHRARLLRNIGKAIKTIHQFEGRIDDASTRAELNRGADRLQQFISSKGTVKMTLKKSSSPSRRASKSL
jgi:hypothetical protein